MSIGSKLDLWLHNISLSYVTEFAKTDLMGTHAEIHFLPVDKSHTHALSRDTKYLRLDGQVRFFQAAFFRRCKTTRVHFVACVAPEVH